LLKLFKGIKRNLFFMVGDGRNMHHLIFIDDLTEGLLLAATAEGAVGKVFVLAGKEPATTSAIVETIARQLGARAPKLRLPLSLLLTLATVVEKSCGSIGVQPPLHRRRMDFFRKSFVFSQEQAGSVLGFVSRVGLEQGVAETAKWYGEMGYL
jgi:dihydroflavonol-4-reductase